MPGRSEVHHGAAAPAPLRPAKMSQHLTSSSASRPSCPSQSLTPMELEMPAELGSGCAATPGFLPGCDAALMPRETPRQPLSHPQRHVGCTPWGSSPGLGRARDGSVASRLGAGQAGWPRLGSPPCPARSPPSGTRSHPPARGHHPPARGHHPLACGPGSCAPVVGSALCQRVGAHTAPRNPRLVLTQHRICPILWVKTSHEVSPESRSGERLYLLVGELPGHTADREEVNCHHFGKQTVFPPVSCFDLGFL